MLLRSLTTVWKTGTNQVDENGNRAGLEFDAISSGTISSVYTRLIFRDGTLINGRLDFERERDSCWTCQTPLPMAKHVANVNL